MLKIPLALPELVLENIPDETGFTMTEKRSLKNAWTIISSDEEKHALEHSLRFLTENEEILNKFRNDKGVINMDALHNHGFMVFDALESLIFEGLEGSVHMHGIVNSITAKHLKKNVEKGDIKKMSSHLSQYLKEVLRRVMSPTLDEAIDKMCAIILEAHEQCEK